MREEGINALSIVLWVSAAIGERPIRVCLCLTQVSLGSHLSLTCVRHLSNMRLKRVS